VSRRAWTVFRVVTELITIAAAVLMGMALWVILTYPDCPQRDSCQIAYRDGEWQIRELPDGGWWSVTRHHDQP